MRRITHILTITMSAVLLSSTIIVSNKVPANADAANAPSLIISQLKITSSNGQFVSLYNTTNTTIDMSKYQLEYFNNYDLAKASSSRLISLSGLVPPHGYFMVNDSTLQLCYQMTVDSVSLGLSSTAGMVEILSYGQSGVGASVSSGVQDYVAWSKTAAVGAQTLPTNTSAFLERQPSDGTHNPNVLSPGGGTWLSVQPSDSNACTIVASSSGTVVQTGLSQLLSPTEPEATITSLTDSSVSATTASLPSTDVGLKAPEITEILPNPAGTGNDATDEYVELYNANIVPFDLSGFSVQAGLTTLYTFTFPTGVTLPAKSFTVYYASDTHITMSNGGGQVKLLDPFKNSIATTAVYATAADGQAWALANGKWYWTTTPTPGAANNITQPVSKKKASSAKTATKSKKTTAQAKASKTKKSKALASSKLAANASSDVAQVTPVHVWTLALVLTLALLYGAYEYRRDLANYLYRFRKHPKDRRPDRAQSERR